jgi:hypothetical protein
MPTYPTCAVCGDFGHSVPMSPRTTGDVELWLCDNPEWCQYRALASLIEAKGWVVTVRSEPFSNEES